MGKNKKESKINDDQIQKIPFQNISHNLTKSRSENRIDKPINLKISKTDSEFSDFNNLSYSKNQTIENPSKKIKETPKSPIKSALLIKQTEKDALNFKKNKEEVTYSNKNIKNDEKTQNLKRSLTPSNKSNIPKGNDSKKIQTNLNNSKIMKKNLQSQKEFSNTSNNSSEEEPLQIKICLDLKKFNKNERNNNNSKPEEKEFENNQFLKGVVKDIDKLTQKMLNTNNNISMQNISQSIFINIIF